MLRAVGVGGNEGQVDLSFHGAGKLDLGTLRRIAQTLQRHLIALGTQIQTLVFPELVNQPVHDPLVDIVTAQMRVAVGGFHFEQAFANLENGNIEGASAKVVYGNGLVLFLVETIGQRGGSGLIDDPLYIEASDFSSVLGCLALGVIKVRRDSNYRIGHFFAEVVFGCLLQLLQNHGGDLLRRVLFPLGDNHHVIPFRLDLEGDHLQFFGDFFIAASHEPFDRIDCVLWVGDRLALGHLPDQSLASFGESNNRWSSAAAFLVGDDFGLASFHDRYNRIRGAEINSNSFRHGANLLQKQQRYKVKSPSRSQNT